MSKANALYFLSSVAIEAAFTPLAKLDAIVCDKSTFGRLCFMQKVQWRGKPFFVNGAQTSTTGARTQNLLARSL
jgi:hypothetical protein